MEAFLGQIQIIGTAPSAQSASTFQPQAVIALRKDSGDAHLDYLKVTLNNRLT